MIHRKAPSILLGLIVLAGVGYLANAGMGINADREIPYAGYLEMNGAAAPSGDYEINFGLYPTAGADDSCLVSDPTACGAWGETQTVTVSAGRFATVLGTGTGETLNDAVIGTARMWVGMAVKGPSDLDFVYLGKQEIVPVPLAARAAAANSYKVTNNLTVGGGLDVSGFSDLGNTGVTGDLDVTGDETVAGAAVVGSNNPGGFANQDGYLYVREGAQFDCQGCGDGSSLFGASEWGNLTIQGRVLSTDDNLHLSPPGGDYVYINDNYRAAGGVASGAGAGLVVEGNIYAGGLGLECQWSACFDTGGSTAVCSSRVPGYPILGGVDIATHDTQFPSGCTSTNHEDEMRVYCCRVDATP
jgi:hypothetical protein